MDVTIRKGETKDIERVRRVICSAFPTGAESRLVEALRSFVQVCGTVGNVDMTIALPSAIQNIIGGSGLKRRASLVFRMNTGLMRRL